MKSCLAGFDVIFRMGYHELLSSTIIGSHFSPVFRLPGHYVGIFKGFLNQVATSNVIFFFACWGRCIYSKL